MNMALLSSNDSCWCTPKDLYDKLNDEFCFALDAAATDSTAKCAKYYTPQDDGLAHTWNCGGAVFCNPPYGRTLGKWVQKGFTESLKMPYPVVMLIPARTDTSYFHDFILGRAEIRFLRGRLRFTTANGESIGNAPFPSMIVVWRDTK